MVSEMNVISALPSSRLRDYVYWFAYYDGFTPGDLGFRMIPEGTVDILIPLEGFAMISSGGSNNSRVEAARPALIGPAQAYTVYDTSSCSRAFGIVFKPGGSARFLGAEVQALTNSIIPADDILGPGVRVLRERLLEEPDPRRMFGIANSFLRRRFEPELRYAEEIEYAVAAIRRGDTFGSSLMDFAENTIGFSHKHFVDLFKRHVGLSPKRYEQIVRFNHLLVHTRHSGQINWKHLAPAFGYVDASHLSKEFRLLAGMTPGEYLRMTWTHRQVVADAEAQLRDP